MTEAIAAFEETLVTPNSRFDKWLSGDKRAISSYELSGYKLFKENGCVACHNGEAVGGNSFQKMGVVEEYKTDNKSLGRIAVSKDESDLMTFKVPTLRNIELTYPYFHDGAAKTLKEAVQTMGKVQLGKQLTDDESERIVAFLKTLTGDQPKFALPILPPSNDKTPKVEPFSAN